LVRLARQPVGPARLTRASPRLLVEATEIV
jgi:hypothetical protein